MDGSKHPGPTRSEWKERKEGGKNGGKCEKSGKVVVCFPQKSCMTSSIVIVPKDFTLTELVVIVYSY